MKIGVLSLQGAVREHLEAVRDLGATGIEVKRPEQLGELDGLILPGGESTAIGLLLTAYGFWEPLRSGLPVFGTCAGLILLAERIRGSEQPRLGLLDIEVERNGFGRQTQSFEAELEIPRLGPEPLTGVFIRAPYVTETGPGVEILARVRDRVVLVRQGRYLGAAFHSELTGDRRLHRYFLDMVEAAGRVPGV